ncbi:MAG: efflux RND transporter permease subunit [Burkholderiales bacterium]
MVASIVRFSIRRAGVVIALAIAVMVYGLYRTTNASLDVFPEFSPTQVVIQTEAPGLSAELVETLVSQPIESGASGVPGILFLRSQSIPGLSVVTVIFSDQSDIYRNRQLVAERLSALQRDLPQNITPNITPLTSSASTVLGVGLTSDKRSLMELRTLVDRSVRPHLLGVSGVADVNVFGGELRQWQIQVQPEKLVRYGLSLEQVTAAARKATAVRGAGFIENVNQRIIVTTEGQTYTREQLAQVVVIETATRNITLGDVATLVQRAAPSIGAAQIDGKLGVFLAIQGQLGANTRAVTIALEKSIRDLAPLLAREQVTMNPRMFRPANFIETAIKNLQRDLMIGLTLVIIVLFFFLFNWRTAFISSTAIPLSLITALIVLDRFGVSLNIMVLGGLAIALGEVVDDAIIDTENIFRRLRENRLVTSPRAAWDVVFRASMEVRSSVVYATFIVALVFVPLLTLGGVAGKLFSPLGIAYILAILASLVIALTVTPALSYLMLARAPLKTADPPLIAWIKPGYLRVLDWVEHHPLSTFASSALVLTVGIALLPLFKGEFIPALKEGHYIIHMSAIPGTSEQESLRIGRIVAQEIGKIRGVQSVAQWVGRAANGPDTFGSHYSEFEIEIGALPGVEQKRILREIRMALTGVEPEERYFLEQEENAPNAESESEEELEITGLSDYLGVNFSVNTFLTERIGETVAGYAAPVVINLFGPDLDNLDRDAYAIASVLSGVRGATDVQVQAPPGLPQLSIRLRHDKLRLWGLLPVDVLETIQTVYEGLLVGQIYQGNDVIGLAVTLAPELKGDLSQAGQLPLRTSRGKLITLKDVADIQQVNGRYKILHDQGKRLQTVTCNVDRRDVEDFVQEAREKINQRVRFAPGNYVVVTGSAEAQAAAREELILHSALAAVGIFVLLYIAFNSLRNLLITFLNLPFALFGGVIAVLLTGGWLSLGSMVGFVTLFGITLRNSIMLVSHYQHLVDVEGRSWNADTARTGAAERLPSILMTALVTALGLLPLALGSGEPGREIEGPMAAIIVGGLVTSTILNLLILPTVLLHFGRFVPVMRNGAPTVADDI